MPSLTTLDVARGALATALIAGGAFVAVPIGPVPVTLQVFFVLLAGMLLKTRVALLAGAAYLALGLVAPVFAGGVAGIGTLLGPTGGYLVGFLPALTITGCLAQRGPGTVGSLVLSGLAGLIPVYLLGVAWLQLQLDLPGETALSAGVLPFVGGDIVKAGLAAIVTRSLLSSPLGLLAPQRDR